MIKKNLIILIDKKYSKNDFIDKILWKFIIPNLIN